MINSTRHLSDKPEKTVKKDVAQCFDTVAEFEASAVAPYYGPHAAVPQRTLGDCRGCGGLLGPEAKRKRWELGKFGFLAVVYVESHAMNRNNMINIGFNQLFHKFWLQFSNP